MPAEIAVRNHAGKRARGVRNADAAEALRCHGDDDFAHCRVEWHEGELLALVHEIAHVFELGAERATRHQQRGGVRVEPEVATRLVAHFADLLAHKG